MEIRVKTSKKAGFEGDHGVMESEEKQGEQGIEKLVKKAYMLFSSAEGFRSSAIAVVLLLLRLLLSKSFSGECFEISALCSSTVD